MTTFCIMVHATANQHPHRCCNRGVVVILAVAATTSQSLLSTATAVFNNSITSPSSSYVPCICYICVKAHRHKNWYPLNKDTTAGNATKLTVQQISLVRFTLAEKGEFLVSATLLAIPRKNGEKKEVETMPAGHSGMLANILGVV